MSKGIEDLKPCPFCGGKAKFMRTGSYTGGVRCSHCGVVTKMVHGGRYITLEKSVERWNRRTSE